MTLRHIYENQCIFSCSTLPETGFNSAHNNIYTLKTEQPLCMITENDKNFESKRVCISLLLKTRRKGKKKKKGDFTYFITFIVLAAIKIFASQTKISRIVIFEPSYSFFEILNSST